MIENNKVLLLTEGCEDNLIDMLYPGFVEYFGLENIYEFPIRKTNHWNSGFGFLHYEPGINFYQDYKVINICSNKNIKDMIDNDKFKYIFLFQSSRIYYPKLIKEFKSNLIKSKPIVYINTGDGPTTFPSIDPYMIETVRDLNTGWMFQREIPLNYSYTNYFPLPFCIIENEKKVEVDNKDIDVYWQGSVNHHRRKALEFVDFNKWKNIIKDSKINIDQFKNKIARSKICLNIRGGGFDTVRFWQLIAQKSFIVSQKLLMQFPDPFIDNKHLIFANDDCSNFNELFEYFLGNDKLREEIANNCYEFSNKFHRSINRIEYIINSINKNKPIRMLA